MVRLPHRRPLELLSTEQAAFSRDDPMDAQVTVVQVAAKPRRRTYTAEYKRRILKEADACATPGAVGALLRRDW